MPASLFPGQAKGETEQRSPHLNPRAGGTRASNARKSVPHTQKHTRPGLGPGVRVIREGDARAQQPAFQRFRNASTSSVFTLPSPLMSAELSPAFQALRNASTSCVFTAPSPLKSATQSVQS